MRKLTKSNVIDLIYDVNIEFINELDYDYESEFKSDITDQDLDMLEEVINKFCFKLENTIEDEFYKGSDNNGK